MSSQLLRILNKHSRSDHFSLLTTAAILHLLLTTFIYMTGRFRLAPDIVDINGIWLPSPSDCTWDRLQIISLVNTLTHDGIAAWLKMSAPCHLKLYSLVFSASSYLFGFTILGAEPLNLFLYLVIVSLIYKIAQEAFDNRVAIVAAVAVAVWPSFLLHTTQLFRDPLFISGLLALVYIGLRCVMRPYSWREGLAAGVMAGATANFLLAVRIRMWILVLAALLVPSSLFFLRAAFRKRFLYANAASILVALILAIGVPILVFSQQSALAGGIASSAAPITEFPSEMWEKGGSHILLLRQRFLDMYPDAGSNIDAQYLPASVSSYLLRATAVGFFAPFPRMWLEAGHEAGRAGRLLAGVETFLMYVVQGLAAYALFREPRKISGWLLVLVAASGMIPLGFVVANIGALYRMRYVFWMLLVVLGARGLQQVRFDIPHAMQIYVDKESEEPGT